MSRAQGGDHHIHNTLGGMAIPQLGDAATGAVGAAAFENSGELRQDSFAVGANDGVGALGDCDGSLGVVTQGQAGHAEGGGFFLDAARIGEHHLGVGLQGEKIEVADWVDNPEVSGGVDDRLQAKRLDASLGARVHGEQNRQIFTRRGENAQHPLTGLWVIDVFGAMDGGEDVAAFDQTLSGNGTRRPRGVKVAEERINHGIADPMDLVGGDSLPQQVVVGIGGWGQEQVADLVGEDPIHLFGHPHVATAQAGFEMRYLYMEFLRNQGAGDGRVDVPSDHHQVGLVGEHHLLEGLHHPRGLHRVTAATDPEVLVGARHTELLEEHP